MKITKREKYSSFYEFLREKVKDYPALKYVEKDCDEYGCDVFLYENRWFGKPVCFFGVTRVQLYTHKYGNEVVQIVWEWMNISGQTLEVVLP